METKSTSSASEVLEALHDTAVDLLRRRDLDDLLEAIVERAGGLVGTRHGYVYLLEPDERMMRVRVGVGFHEDHVGARVSRGEGLAGRIWESGEPLVVESYRTWPSRVSTAAYDVLRSIVGVPLAMDDKVLGVLALSRIEEGPSFGDRDVGLLTLFAELASIALDNASLYEGLRTQLAERARAEQELAESELHYRTLFEGAQDAIYLIEGERIVDCNGATGRLFECPRDRIVGRSVFDFSADLQAGGTPAREVGTRHVQAALQGTDQRFSWSHRTATGRVFQAEVALNRFHIEGRSRLFVISRDVTEQKRLEAQLLHAQKLEALGRLAGGVANDFNNVITAIMGVADLARARLERGVDIDEQLREIGRSCEHAAALVRQLLTFSRTGAMQPRRIDLGEAVAETETMVARLLGDEVLLTMELEPDLPEVFVDPLLVQQVVISLAINARDSMVGGGQLAIRTRKATAVEAAAISPDEGPATPAVALTVTDSGPGMPADALERLFEPFDSADDEAASAGLGLSTICGIIRESGGEILVESAPDAGTRFTVVLPAANGA